jgi:hypothetical protein
MEIWLCDRVAFVGSLLLRSMTTGFFAGWARLTGKGSSWPGATVKVGGTIISPPKATVIDDVPSVTDGALALIVAEPAATPDTVAVVVVSPAEIVALLGLTVAKDGLLETSDTVRPPAGAGPESVIVSGWEPPTGTEALAGVMDRVALTGTV